MDWSKGYSAQWRVFRVDAGTWADSNEVDGLGDISISRTNEGRLESGSFTAESELEPGYYRIAMLAIQEDASERVDIATLLCTTSDYEIERGSRLYDVECASVLQPAADKVLFNGEFAPAGGDGAAYVGKLLEETIAAPVVVEGAFTLDSHIVFDVGTSVLDAIWSVLNAGGFCMQIDGRGVVHIRMIPITADLVLDADSLSLVMPGVSVTDTADIPNRYIAIEDDLIQVAINDDETSSTSVPSVGRYIDMLDESPTRINGETLASYAQRRLEEESANTTERTYKREYVPDVYPFSLVRGLVASAGLDGNMRITSQAIECANGALVTEKAVIKEYTWRR